MGSKAKWEYFRVVYERYRKSERAGKKVMLDEFCRNIGYNRKYAIRLLTCWTSSVAIPATTANTPFAC